MAHLCKFGGVLKCGECDHVFHRNCAAYIKANLQILLKPILPYKFPKVRPEPKDSGVYYMHSLDIKDHIAASCFKQLRQVKKVSINQAITIQLGSLDIEDCIYFLDTSQKIYEPTKIQAVLESFVDRVSMENGLIFIYMNNRTLTVPESWVKL